MDSLLNFMDRLPDFGFDVSDTLFDLVDRLSNCFLDSVDGFARL